MSDTRNHTTRDQLAEVLYGLTWTSEFTDAEDEIQESYRDRADELLASDAIAAVRAAAVAETTATIEATTAPLLSIAAQAVRSAYSDDAEELSSALTMTGLHLRDVLDNLRAALSGGRTALDTTLTQARADAFDQALMQVVSGIRSAKEAHAERGHRAIVAALVGLIGAVPDTPNPYRADTGADQ